MPPARSRGFGAAAMAAAVLLVSVACSHGAPATDEAVPAGDAVRLLQPEKAIDHYRQQIDAGTLAPGELARAEMQLGLAFLMTGQKERAWKAFRRALAIDRALTPDPKLFSPWALALFENARAALSAWEYVVKGADAADSGRPDEAIALYSKALESKDLFLPGIVAAVYGLRGKAREGKKDYDGAIGDCTRAILYNPFEADYYIDRGLSWAGRGNDEEALADYAAALTADPACENACNNRGSIFYRRNDLDRAMAEFTRAVEVNPRSAIGFFNRGQCRKRKGDIKGAIEDFSATIARNPDHALALYNRAEAYDRMKNAPGAFADVRRYRELVPADPDGIRLHESLKKKYGER